MKFPFVGGAYKGRSTQNNPQECLNLYPSTDIADAKEPTILIGTPGLLAYLDLPSEIGEDGGKVRAMVVHGTDLYTVIGENLIRYESDGTVTDEGSVTTISNLITNGDMELDSTWTGVGVLDGAPVLSTNEQSDEQAHGGTYSWKLTLGGNTTEGIKSGTFSTVAGVTYELRFWVYPVDRTKVLIGRARGDGSFYLFTTWDNLTPNAWNYRTFTFTETISGSDAYVAFKGWGNPGTGVYYFDDVTMFSNTNYYGLTYVTSNTTYIAGVEPGAGGWTMDFATETLAAISDGDFPTPRSMCFLDGYFIVTEEGTNRWFISNLNDPTAWEALDYSSTGGISGTLKACISLTGQVALLGEHGIEFHAHTGASDWPFQRVAVVDTGLGPDGSLCKDEEDLYFINDKQEVVRVRGYQIQKISTEAVDYFIQGYALIDDATSFIYAQEGHKFYQLSFTTEDVTWVFDITLGLWHRRSSTYYDGAGDDYQGRNRAETFAVFNGQQIVGDFENGLIYKYSLDLYTDAGTPIQRKRVTPVLTSEEMKISYHRFQLLVDSHLGDELVINGDMEKDDNWTDVGSVIAAQLDSIAHSGTYSWGMLIGAAGAGIKSDTFTTITGHKYRISCWVYTNNATTLDIYVRNGDNSGYSVAYQKTGIVSSTWTYVEYDFIETAGGSGAYVFFTGGVLTAGEWEIDDVSVKLFPELEFILKWSDDGGSTYSSEYSKTIDISDRKSRLIWRRLGSARNRVFQVTTEARNRVVVLGAELKASKGIS